MARPRKNPQAGAAGEGAAGEGAQSTQSTGSTGRHRTGKRMTLQNRVTALVQSQNKRLISLADQIKQIARGG
jgi:hypothetical protein